MLDRFAAVAETIREPEQLRTYECDGLTGHRVVPALVALPGSVEEVQAVVRLCNEERVPFVARGAGTGLFTQPLKKVAIDLLGFGLALEGLAAVHESSGEVPHGFRWA